jgi:hypothetical protein
MRQPILFCFIALNQIHCGFATRGFVTLVVKRGSILILFYCLKAHLTALGWVCLFNYSSFKNKQTMLYLEIHNTRGCK